MRKIFITVITTLTLLSCSTQRKPSRKSLQTTAITSLSFIDEVVIPNKTTFQETKVGGLSGIDYANNNWYVISDDRAVPRFYTIDLSYTRNGFDTPKIIAVTYLKNKNNQPFKKGTADPESLRAISTTEIIWSSEGDINKGIQPFVRRAAIDGSYGRDITITDRFLVQKDTTKGPVNNGVFEGLCKDYKGEDFWVLTELPLKEDGLPPTYDAANSPVRLAHIDGSSGAFTKEYAYPLDKVARKGKLEVNGVTEILSYDQDQFLVLERSYASGHSDGGNDVKIYKVDVSKATDVSNLESLATANYIPAQKTLLLDFETIRTRLTDGIVDNIEGMTFGPIFKNGNRTLVLISDNNFNTYGKQITQIIIFEIQ